MRTRLNDLDETEYLFTDDEINDALWAARLFDPEQLQSLLQWQTWTSDKRPFEIDTTTGKLSFYLTDLIGEKEDFLWTPPLPVLPYGRLVTVGEGKTGTEADIADDEYEFNETQMVVAFLSARTETVPFVRLKGWIADTDLALYNLFGRLETKATVMMDSRGQEISNWLKRIRETKAALQPAVIHRRGDG